MVMPRRRQYGLIGFGKPGGIDSRTQAAQMYGQAASTFARIQPQVKQTQKYSPSFLENLEGAMNLGITGYMMYKGLQSLGIGTAAKAGTALGGLGLGGALALGMPAAVLVGGAIFDLF